MVQLTIKKPVCVSVGIFMVIDWNNFNNKPPDI